MDETRRDGPFIVVGMGRSGTSYVGSILDASGVSMGPRLKPPDEHNQMGYFEDLESTQMHERWLERRGLTLASVCDAFPLDALPEERGELASFIARRELAGRPWGLKAPGILFFWDAWREVLPTRSILLVAFRHPSAVAESFAKYGLERDTALALWLQLNRLSLQAALGGPFECVFLDFDDRERFAQALRPVLGSYADPYRSALRHELPRAEPLPAEFQQLYGELLAQVPRV